MVSQFLKLLETTQNNVHVIWRFNSHDNIMVLFTRNSRRWRKRKKINLIKFMHKFLVLRHINSKRKKYIIVNILWYLWVISSVTIRVMVFSATFNNILFILTRTVFSVEETGVPGYNHQPVASHLQTLSYNVVSSMPRHEGIRTHNISGDRHRFCIGSCKSNYICTIRTRSRRHAQC